MKADYKLESSLLWRDLNTIQNSMYTPNKRQKRNTQIINNLTQDSIHIKFDIKEKRIFKIFRNWSWKRVSNKWISAETYKHSLRAQLCTKPIKLNYHLAS